ncbi:MAG TPA: GntR family transcriptional regulator [Candidatus Sulfomarinibacteraceae bacterium]|nr:GntR family transcriptional regulator [Candidatus Sulfomarinibacteraceae bacterium]
MIRSIPLADQLIQELATAISAGDIANYDGRLPSETELSQKYGVSRSTVREVLARLESAGVVVRRRGIGTFISEPLRNQPDMIWGWLDQAPAFIDLIAQAGYESRDEVLHVEVRPAGEEVGEPLDIPAEESIVAFEKRFWADDNPIIYSWTAVAEKLIDCGDGDLLDAELYRRSIYQFLRSYCRREVSHQTSEVHAIEAGDEMAQYLACKAGAPLLHVAEIGYAEEGIPLFYATHFFRGDRVSFRQIRIPTFTIEPV